MKQYRSRLLWSAVLFGVSASLVAGSSGVSPVQSPLRPLGLPIVGSVYVYGADSTAQAFEAYKSTYTSYCKSKLPEGKAFTGAGLNQLDPQRLYFLFDYAPRVYFLYEAACYTDGLGATIASVSNPTNAVLTGNTFTIFPNQHWSSSPTCSTGSGKRSTTEPLLPGDFVQLPTIKAGQQLAFFLMANEDSNGKPANVFYNGSSNNSDNFQHLVAFFPDNSQYMIIGFEDMSGGGDKDCNDVLFVVDVGPLNSQIWRNPNSLPR
jgi:hypothetical protein